MEHPENYYLGSSLEPLSALLARTDVTDIYVNRPHEVWVESLGGATERYELPELSSGALRQLARQIAATTSQGVNREHPLLAASLPDGSRVQIVLPPATRGDIAIAIRKHVVAELSLEDYERTGSFKRTNVRDLRDEPPRSRFREEAAQTKDVLRRAVVDRKNILIAGGTSSGKTTFLNALLREIPRQERLILIEDTPELVLTHPNSVGLIAARSQLGEAQVDAEDLLIASLRMRPDRIILGEMRGKEAVTFLRAVNTGHPGSISTIHADSPRRAIDQLALLVLKAGTNLSWDDVTRYITRSVDYIVQLKRSSSGARVIDEVLSTHSDL